VIVPILIVPLLVGAPIRVVIDAGHGLPGNEGTLTALCDKEQDVVLRIALDVAARLEQDGRFRVLLARTATRAPSYARRVDAAERFGADALIGIHLDSRGALEPIACADGRVGYHGEGHAGFAVLRSDQGQRALVDRRAQLSRSIARHLAGSGFAAYDGEDYPGLYWPDRTTGVFVDRRGLLMLRAPRVPSVIIETHHGANMKETLAWREPRTLAAFSEALAAALVELLQPEVMGRDTRNVVPASGSEVKLSSPP
jgi:N-acetylmuramoyl-L-alanine amidase